MGLTHRDCLDLISIVDGILSLANTVDRLRPDAPRNTVAPAHDWLLDLRYRLLEEAQEKPH